MIGNNLIPAYRVDDSLSRDTSPARDEISLQRLDDSSTAYLNCDYVAQHPVRHLGVPRRKRKIDWINAAMLATSFSLFVIAVLVISPGTGVAYRLGYNYQLTALGIILASAQLRDHSNQFNPGPACKPHLASLDRCVHFTAYRLGSCIQAVSQWSGGFRMVEGEV